MFRSVCPCVRAACFRVSDDESSFGGDLVPLERGNIRTHRTLSLYASQIENADVFDFSLTDDEVAAISGLERGRLWGGDPDTHEEM